jgi:hypothetical protein
VSENVFVNAVIVIRLTGTKTNVDKTGVGRALGGS